MSKLWSEYIHRNLQSTPNSVLLTSLSHNLTCQVKTFYFKLLFTYFPITSAYVSTALRHPPADVHHNRIYIRPHTSNCLLLICHRLSFSGELISHWPVDISFATQNLWEQMANFGEWVAIKLFVEINNEMSFCYCLLLPLSVFHSHNQNVGNGWRWIVCKKKKVFSSLNYFFIFCRGNFCNK